ncbi:MAG TPA: calcium/proton exchanger [Chthonomonadaceae bacterium]|nr:calcium/proton exchanger [Chthonomonadaceae bacterium]
MRWMLVMLVFVPISILLHFLGAPGVVMFVVSCLAIVPLAGYMGLATEELAKYRGPAVGGLLNATFGNATELIIAIVALSRDEIEVVKASLIGSIVGNILLVLGLSILLGGLKYKVQSFNKDLAGMHAAMLAMAVISILVPALFVRSVPGMREDPTNWRIESLSLGVAGVLLLLYVGSIIFSLWTHEDLFRGGEAEEAEPPHWPQGKAVAALLASTLFVALESEYLVASIEPVVHQWKVSPLFIGVIVVPIIGNAAEHSAAVLMALRNKMDISFNIALSSSTQIAMFVAPVVIFAGLLIGHPITVLFINFELIAVAVSVAIAALISLDGRSHWLEGAQLLAAYVIVALAFYFIPAVPVTSGIQPPPPRTGEGRVPHPRPLSFSRRGERPPPPYPLPGAGLQWTARGGRVTALASAWPHLATRLCLATALRLAIHAAGEGRLGFCSPFCLAQGSICFPFSLAGRRAGEEGRTRLLSSRYNNTSGLVNTTL